MIENLPEGMNWNVLLPLAIEWGLKVLGALAILLIGRWIAGAISRSVRQLVLRNDIDAALASFLSRITYAVLLVTVVVVAIGTLGVSMASVLAIMGAAGLAVGLALQGSLSNFAAGVMLILFRPFKAGDYVEAAGVSGNVEDIQLFNTLLRTPDNREVTVPNAQITAEPITNYSARPTRRVDMVIGISYDDDIRKAKEIIEATLAEDARVLTDPEPQIMVLELGESCVNIAVRPWVKTDDYWDCRGDLLHALKSRLEAGGLSIPFPQRDLHLFDMRAREAANG
ncbi:MAG: mechanosensitive ion channel family protein [Gammaproteobacteria bacterium]